MSFEDFTLTCTRTFSQTPIRLVRLSSSLTAYIGSLDQPYRPLVLLCQPHFTLKSISIAFYLNGTAYFEYLNEDKIRQRLQLLNSSYKKSYHRNDLQPLLIRLQTMLLNDKSKLNNVELNAKLVSSKLLSIELNQNDFKFKFRCDERPELYEQHYVRQLLLQIKELSQRQTYLCDLLEHRNQLAHFDANVFLKTPLTFIDDDDENEDEDDDMISSSTTALLWKSAFDRPGGAQFLDMCLLQKAYFRTLEDSNEGDDDDSEAISSILNSLVDKIEKEINDDDDDDDLGLAQRLVKRALKASTVKHDGLLQPMKRLKGHSTNANISI